MPLERYSDWLLRDALPFWLARTADDSGLFYEGLDLTGIPQPERELRLRTGMRQVYVFAHAGYLELVDPATAIALAETMAHRLRGMAWEAGGAPGWAARFQRSGEITDGRRDLYDHAFVLMALAHLRLATGNGLYEQWIDETLAVVDDVLAASHGGWAENDRHELPRRQNPHMHMFEACLGLFETTGAKAHLQRAESILDLLADHFIDPETGLLTEYFGPAWERSPAIGSDRLEPGHMMEWVWLLRRYRRSGHREIDGICSTFFAGALRVGETADGFLVDEADAAGKPLIDRRRLWPQTEYLKALMVQSVATGDESLLDSAGALFDRIEATYLSGVPRGTWCDQFDLDGRPTAPDIPASILYHAFAPVVEVLRLTAQASA